MPEEKVTKRHNPDVSEWGFSQTVPVLPKPAADAGPRQPCPHVNTMCHEWESRCLDCGEVWKHATPDYSVTTTVPPAPQEAAPRCPTCKSDRKWVHGKLCEVATCADSWHETATTPDSAMRVAEQIGTCRTPHFMGEPTVDRKALTQIPHQELPQGLCRDWQAIDRVAATKEPQSKGQDGSPVFMQTNTAPVYMCPAGCGCLWRDNQDGTMSLYGPNSKSCEKCEYMPLKELTPLIREAGSERERRLEDALRNLRDRLQIIMAWPDEHWSKHLPIEIESELAEASRLLGGE